MRSPRPPVSPRSSARLPAPRALLALVVLALVLLALVPGPTEAQERRDGRTADRPHPAAAPDSAGREAAPDRGRLVLGPWAERLVGLAALAAADEGVGQAARDFRQRTGERSGAGKLAHLGNRLGDWQTSLPWVAGGALAGGALLDGADGAGRGASLLVGVVAGSMANEAVNQLVGRSRPIWGNGAYTFRPLTGHAAFPSGHTAYAFSIAAGLDAVTDGWLPAAAGYGLAGVSAYGRLYDGKHWLSDVVVGAVLSSAASSYATRRAMRMLGVADEDEGEDGSASGDRADPGPQASLLATPSTLGVRIRF